MSLSKCTLNFFRKNDVFRAGGSSLNFFIPKSNLGTVQPEKVTDKYNVKSNKALTDAEKLIGFRSSLISLRYLLTEDVGNVVEHVRKLASTGTKHPLVKTVKQWIYNADKNVQTWRLTVLLISKALGRNSNIDVDEAEKRFGFLQSQLVLAEIIEMIKTSHVIHKVLINLSKDIPKEELADVINGNKLALLSGDHLLSTSCLQLAKLENQDLVELISSAVRDLSEAEFIGLRDHQNLPLPSPPRLDSSSNFKLPENSLVPIEAGDALGVAKAEWTLRNVLGGGNLLGKACQGALLLAGHSTTTQKEAYHFGMNMALAWQINSELQSFSPDVLEPFSLVSAPVMFMLQENPDSYSEIEKGQHNVYDVDYQKLRELVHSSSGIEMSKKLLQEHTNSAFEFLEKLPYSEARGGLEGIVSSISSV